MKFRTRTLFFTFAIIGFIVAWKTPFSFAQARQKKFIYDLQGRRDPFIPLIDKESPTGLRTEFSPPEARIKLPVEIKVEGILWKGEESFIIINGEVLKKGENLGAVRIKEIEEDKVILQYGERDFTVFLRKEKEK